MLQLVAPDGKLVCLEFPTWKDPKTAGPPFALRPEFYVAHLSRPGVHVPYNEDGYLAKDATSGEDLDLENGATARRLERISHFPSQKSHDYGIENNVDWVSIWKHGGS